MVRIRDLVEQALATGYLTVVGEEQLRSLLRTSGCESEDLTAFAQLQQAVMAGNVKQESREQMSVQQHPSR